ncbi:MAG: sulfurtransferase-like selenium metabolism protein YedF [Desulfovermiculus sp.]
MAEITLQCQGLDCPQPVLKCKETIDISNPDRLIVQVDNEAARENVTRFLRSQNYQVLKVQDKGGIFELTAEPKDRDASAAEKAAGHEDRPQTSPAPGPSAHADDAHLVLITSNVIGHGDEELGHKLMHNFIATLPEMGPSLWRILLLNSGVKLAVEHSPVLDNLKRLEENGVSILVCGTCLDFFNLLEQKQVGQTTNMLDVVTSLQLADKVIKV